MLSFQDLLNILSTLAQSNIFITLRLIFKKEIKTKCDELLNI